MFKTYLLEIYQNLIYTCYIFTEMVRKIKRALFSVLLTSFLLALLFVQMAYAYESTSYGFSITQPSSWEIIEQTGISYVAVSFQNVDAAISIDIWVSDTNYSLMEGMEGTKQSLAASYVDFELLSEQSRSVGGLDCYELVYTVTQNNVALELKQVYFVGYGKVYAVTCTALESEFSSFLSTFEASILSFQIFEASDPTDNSDDSPDNTMLIIGVVAAAVILAVLVAILLLKKRGHARRKRKPRGR